MQFRSPMPVEVDDDGEGEAHEVPEEADEGEGGAAVALAEELDLKKATAILKIMPSHSELDNPCSEIQIIPLCMTV